MKIYSCGLTLDFDRPRIMGVLNVTQDSFSDGGEFLDVKKAVLRVLQMVQEGADIIDIGGESTGPGSRDVSVDEEWARVMPVLRSLAENRNFLQGLPWVSLDTYKVEVVRRALEFGIRMVNDVTALRGDPDMARFIAETGISVVLMYSKDPTARTTLEEVHYKDVVRHIMDFFQERLEYAFSQGIRRGQIILDPGMGAFLSVDPRYSIDVLKRLKEFHSLGFPLLIGASRKGFIGKLLGDVGHSDRLEGSLACVAQAVSQGVHLLRVHDVLATRRFLDVFCNFFDDTEPPMTA